MLQIYFTKPTRILQRHPFFSFSFKGKDSHNLMSQGTNLSFAFVIRHFGVRKGTNISFKMNAGKPCKTLQISMALFCKFLECINTDLSFSNSS